MTGRAISSLLVLVSSLATVGVAHAQATPPGAPATTTPTPPRQPTLPGRAPEACGQTDQTADYGEIALGSVVTLQRHRFVAGDDNWDPQMDRYLGRAAHVTRLTGVDEQGCPGVRVDIDGQQWFWRIRDLGLGTGLQPLPPAIDEASPFPQQCHQPEMAAQWGAATLGTAVVLGRHRPVDGDTNWADEMQVWVGQTARIVQQASVDSQGCPGVRVDIDGQQWFWRIRDLRIPTGETSYTPSLGITTDHGRPPASVGTGIFGSGGEPGPQECGLTEGSVVWGGVHVGASVTLGRHREVNGDSNWDGSMEAFVGMRTQVSELVGVDEQGCPVVRVGADGGNYYWRVRDMTVDP